MEFTVGQKLWCVMSDRRGGSFPGREVTITKVGRKWLTIDYADYRVDMGHMFVDGHGYASPGRCYLSKEEYEKIPALQAAWKEFRARLTLMYGTIPEGVTVEDIREAMKLLKLEE